MKKPTKQVKKEISNVRLIKAQKGYFLEVKDQYTEYRWAITEYELLLINKVVSDEVKKLL